MLVADLHGSALRGSDRFHACATGGARHATPPKWPPRSKSRSSWIPRSTPRTCAPASTWRDHLPLEVRRLSCAPISVAMLHRRTRSQLRIPVHGSPSARSVNALRRREAVRRYANRHVVEGETPSNLPRRAVESARNAGRACAARPGRAVRRTVSTWNSHAHCS